MTVTFGAPAAVAGAYTPVVEVPEQVAGGTTAFLLPQLAGYWPARRWDIVTNAAYDQVRSFAESGTPVSRLNCSAREPLTGIYFSAMATNESANAVAASIICAKGELALPLLYCRTVTAG